MPGMFTPHKGSSLPTSTVWFGGVAEWLNMLKRWDGVFDGSNLATATDPRAAVACNFAKDAGLFGATLGAFTTAPDGTTNTAQLIQEDTSTGQHTLLLCTSYYVLRHACMPTGDLRLAGYWKAGPTARRLIYEIRFNTPFSYPADVYAYVIFDLAGGQIGVAPTLVGSHVPSLSPVVEIGLANASITPAPDGFFLCTLDWSENINIGDYPEIRVILDNGTGTNPRSDSYTGTLTGTPGVFGWKINQMPPGAYGINRTSFFDDFLTLDTIDVHNSKVAINPATGQPYKWFVDANMAEWTLTVTVPPASAFQISTPSILRMLPYGPGGTQIAMTSWTNASPISGTQVNPPGQNPGVAGPGIGQGWQIPMLVEFRIAIRVDLAPWGGVAVDGGGGGMAVWGETIEIFEQNGAVGASFNPAVSFFEVDYIEIGAGGGSEQFVPHLGFPFWGVGDQGSFPADPLAFTGGNSTSLSGTGLYQGQNVYRHAGSSVVMNGSDGIKYQQFNFPFVPTNTPPPDGGVHWNPLAAPPPPTRGNPAVPQDISQFNTWSTLLLPWHGSPGFPNGPNSAGICLTFFNGCYVGPGVNWTPNGSIFGHDNPSGPQNGEGQHRILFVAVDGTTANPGVPQDIDWIKVWQ